MTSEKEKILAGHFHNEANLIGAYCYFQIQSLL